MSRSLRVHLARDPELNSIWVAHVLDLDLVTQGATLGEALDMARDAAEVIVADDLSHGRDPSDRMPKPQGWLLYDATGNQYWWPSLGNCIPEHEARARADETGLASLDVVIEIS